MDFGASRPAGEGPAGTPLYSAPEAHSGRLCKASDVYLPFGRCFLCGGAGRAPSNSGSKRNPME
jgi:hypothetical protein